MNNGPAGFQNAPVTKGLIIATAILSIAVSIRRTAPKCSISYQEVVENYHLWKLVTSALMFSSTPELIFGLSLLYYFRVFERQIGSNKYLVFVLFSITAALVFELIYLIILKDIVPSRLISGPYELIFSSFVPFYLDIPVSTQFRVFGIRFSDKAFVYLAGLQLLLSAWTCSLIPGLCGICAGLSYRLNPLGVRRVKFPDQLASTFSHMQLPFFSLGLLAAPSRSNLSRGNSNLVERQSEEEEAAVAPLLEERVDPSDAALATLVAMGFDRNLAIQALLSADNDLNVATNVLLEMQPQRN